ncbi:SpoIIIAH-like family protein [Paenibacillus solisilvae]|uniref:SpoIIIAH-like family protein n=1 Tax=Paenibacillus solisilvae TaxID=2486751 RepID=A0ABW0W0R8_9BACL
MNTKRQTVWLVSMLSLMVILSAYYLFTEDVNKSSDLLTDGTQQQEQVVTDATEAGGDAAATDGINVTEVSKDVPAPDGAASSDVTAEDGTAVSDVTDDTAAADDGAISKEDQAALDKVEASGVTSVFSQLQEKRDTQFNEEYNKVYGAISDTTQNEKDAGKAVDQLDQLEEKSAKITGLEEELQKQYNQAAVSPEPDGKYKIVVESEKLERSQADGIMQMVIKELGVTADQVIVQFIQ